MPRKTLFFFSLLLIATGCCLPAVASSAEAGLLAVGFAHAAPNQPYTLEMPLEQGQNNVQGLGNYVRMVFVYGLSLVGIVALFAMVYGGFRYMTSGSSQDGITRGKQWIWGALSGIVLLLCSYLILYTINPDLVSLREPNLPQIVIEPPPPPTQAMLNLGSRTGVLPDQLSFRDTNMEARFNDRAPNDLRQVVNSFPFPVQITSYDQGSHATNSAHYQGRAIDIYIGNMNDDQLKTMLTYLKSNGSSDQIICGRMPEYNTLNGQPHAYSASTNSDHMNHIHFATYGK